MIRAITTLLAPECAAPATDLAAYCRDLDKIVLDKGLIALIAAVVTIVAAWRLEAFKSRLKSNEERRRLELANAHGMFDKVDAIMREIEAQFGYIAKAFHDDMAVFLRLLDAERDDFQRARNEELAGAENSSLQNWVAQRIEPRLAPNALSEMAQAVAALDKKDAAHFWDAARLSLVDVELPRSKALANSHVYMMVATKVYPRCARRHRLEIARQGELLLDLMIRFVPESYDASERALGRLVTHIADIAGEFPAPFYELSREQLRRNIADRLGPVRRAMLLALREIIASEGNSRRFRRSTQRLEAVLTKARK